MALRRGDTLDNGRYTIIKILEGGGFGLVYMASDRRHLQPVAIKELAPVRAGDRTILDRFMGEADLTMRLTHPHLVHTRDIIQESGNWYIVMDFMPGGSLAKRLQRQPLPIPVDEVQAIADDLCSALAYIHSKHVYHCDVKPANVLFDDEGRARLADFGIAYLPAELRGRSWHTATGSRLGTLRYMAPEQMAGVRDDPRVDVYALGVIVYEMLAGRGYLDFDESDTPLADANNIAAICSQAPSPLSGVPHRLNAAVMRALAKNPRDRYPDILHFRAALRQVAGVRSVTARLMARVPALFWVLVGALMALLLVGAAILITSVGGTSAQQTATAKAGLASAVVPTVSPASGDGSLPPTSIPSPIILPTAVLITDWRAEYYDNPSLDGVPHVVRNDTAIDFNWGDGPPGPDLPADRFSARWTRLVDLEAGTYHFDLTADDGARFWLDGQPVLDEWDSTGRTEHDVDVELTAGEHALRVEYYEDSGQAEARLWWLKVPPSATQTPTPTLTLTPTLTATPLTPTPTPTPTPTVTPTPTSTPTPTPTPTATPTPTPTTRVHDLPFYDDFNINQGWNLWTASHGAAEIVDGRFRLSVLYPFGVIVSTYPRLAISDFELQVDTDLGTPTDKPVSMGVVLRHYAETGGYIFGINNYGEYELKSMAPSGFRAIIEFTDQPVINRSGLNTLKVVMKQDQITLWINGTQVAQLSDSTYTSGDFGFYGCTLGGQQQAIVEFDNLSVLSR